MSGNLQVSVYRKGRCGVLKTDGDIINVEGEQLVEACDALFREGVQDVVLNLEGSRLINSYGISIMIEIIEKARERQGRIAFCCATPTVAKMFRIMGLLKTAGLYDTQDGALQALSGARLISDSRLPVRPSSISPSPASRERGARQSRAG